MHKDDSQASTISGPFQNLIQNIFFRAQWKRVQCISELFWQKLKKEYLVHRDGKNIDYTTPITERFLLVDN